MSDAGNLEARSMRREDLDEVLSIEQSSFATPWTRNMFLKEISNPNAIPVVFLLDGSIVGYVCFWLVMDEAHLMNISIHPQERGQGLGTEALAYLDNACRKHRLSKIVLEVGRRNARARRLYKKSGFQTVGFRKGYYSDVNDDALIMEKKL
jgi:[ribosomal protein S18]-alanine N-acetyltransferase